jgi:phage baseplate assembly protein V
MGGWLGAILRRARLRGLKEGLVQTVRVEALEHEAHDNAERHQDYGFAGNPVDGQGLKVSWGGHTVVLRMDRLADRPQLAAYEVAVWHKDGHMVRLRDGGLVQVDCTRLEINASAGIALNTPTVAVSAALMAAGSVSSPTVTAGSSLKVGGKEMSTHTHGGVAGGGGHTTGPD